MIDAKRRGAVCVASLALALAAGAAPDPDRLPVESVRNDDYAAGLAARERGDWQALLSAMRRVLERRPWHDDAHNLSGFAYRKLGDYRLALRHYRTALDLNPHNRGALEYLGKAHLELGDRHQAEVVLQRLAVACERAGRAHHCAEWQALHAAVAGDSTGHAHTVSGSWPGQTAEPPVRSLLSAQGLYRVSFRSRIEPVPVNRMHGWVLHVETAAGEPVDDACITVDGGMPEHHHGLPSAPQISAYLGGGDYQVDGLKFHMNGWWTVSFYIASGAAGGVDDVTFDLAL